MENFPSQRCGYANNGKWADGQYKNPVYIGTNSKGTYKYVGQFIFPPIAGTGKITKIELTLYRENDNATYTRAEYYGCTEDQTDYGSVLSTGQTVDITGGAGFKDVDISGIIDAVSGYTGEWALLLGNPNTKGTYVSVSGYGSGKAPYLSVYYDTGTQVGYHDGETLRPCKVFRAISATELQQCNIYRATDAITLEKL